MKGSTRLKDLAKTPHAYKYGEAFIPVEAWFDYVSIKRQVIDNKFNDLLNITFGILSTSLKQLELLLRLINILYLHIDS